MLPAWPAGRLEGVALLTWTATGNDRFPGGNDALGLAVVAYLSGSGSLRSVGLPQLRSDGRVALPFAAFFDLVPERETGVATMSRSCRPAARSDC